MNFWLSYMSSIFQILPFELYESLNTIFCYICWLFSIWNSGREREMSCQLLWLAFFQSIPLGPSHLVLIIISCHPWYFGAIWIGEFDSWILEAFSVEVGITIGYIFVNQVYNSSFIPYEVLHLWRNLVIFRKENKGIHLFIHVCMLAYLIFPSFEFFFIVWALI